jgi:hypothetical protein
MNLQNQYNQLQSMPRRRHHIFWLSLLLAFGLTTCRQAYDPPAINNPNNYLVVDGFINVAQGGVSTFNVNRTRNLGDSSTTGIPELSATVSIVSSGGSTYPLIDTGNTGIYSSFPLNLDITQQYSIAISTTDGRKYASDPVPCKITPPIDSFYFQQPSDFTVYVNTHDPANNTHYYRYDYVETWQHDAELQSPWINVNGLLQATDSSNQKSICWNTAPSTNILLATSQGLAQDIISHYPLTTIPNGDPKLFIGISILVRQYALTQDAYNYWLLIQKTSQNVGTLFDLQPTQLIGNLHCLSNPAEPVIGFVSACTVQQERLFVPNSALQNWSPPLPTGSGCDTVTIPSNPSFALIYNYPDTNFAPWYFDGAGNLVLASRYCLDCTTTGGTTIQPSFWP